MVSISAKLNLGFQLPRHSCCRHVGLSLVSLWLCAFLVPIFARVLSSLVQPVPSLLYRHVKVRPGQTKSGTDRGTEWETLRGILLNLWAFCFVQALWHIQRRQTWVLAQTCPLLAVQPWDSQPTCQRLRFASIKWIMVPTLSHYCDGWNEIRYVMCH